MPAIRPIRISGDLAFVSLTRGYEAVIDVDDVPLVEGRNWYADVKSHTVYAAAQARVEKGRQTTILMHRLLMGFPSGLQVDHIDGNGLNNRRRGDAGNLRSATNSENQCNARVGARNTSGFKGVTLNRRARRYQAAIKINGKSIYLGLFDTAEAAHSAYCTASVNLHGNFGRTA